MKPERAAALLSGTTGFPSRKVVLVADGSGPIDWMLATCRNVVHPISVGAPSLFRENEYWTAAKPPSNTHFPLFLAGDVPPKLGCTPATASGGGVCRADVRCTRRAPETQNHGRCSANLRTSGALEGMMTGRWHSLGRPPGA